MIYTSIVNKIINNQKTAQLYFTCLAVQNHVWLRNFSDQILFFIFISLVDFISIKHILPKNMLKRFRALIDNKNKSLIRKDEILMSNYGYIGQH